MIKDKLEHAGTYYGISARLKQGFEWLKNNDMVNMPDGKHTIDGDKIFANVQSYQILEQGDFLVFFPQDAHQPSLDNKEKLYVKKVIVKVAI